MTVMLMNFYRRRTGVYVLMLAFLAQLISGTPVAAEELLLPQPGHMVPLSASHQPPVFKGLKIHPQNPFHFDFILDKGDEAMPTGGHVQDRATENVSPSRLPSSKGLSAEATQRQKADALKLEANKLIKYFLASLTVPEKDLWVNLSPYEKDRIVPDAFGQTEMGRDLLAQDYLLKQITASLLYPEGETGKKFWSKVYATAKQRFGTNSIPVSTFNKVWIVPEKAVVYENARAGTAYIIESKLKVMLEQDYVALQRNRRGEQAKRVEPQDYLALSQNVIPATFGSTRYEGAKAGIHSKMDARQKHSGMTDELASQILRELVIPQLTKEVNEGQNFAQLRQVYNSLILAHWYKKKIKDSILAKIYADKNKIAGLLPTRGHVQDRTTKNVSPSGLPSNNGLNVKATEGTDPLDVDPLDVDAIYHRYLEAFKKGAYNYIKEEIDPATRQLIPRKYFSGGVQIAPYLEQALVSTGRIDSAQIGSAGESLEVEVDLSPMDSANKSGDGTGPTAFSDQEYRRIESFLRDVLQRDYQITPGQVAVEVEQWTSPSGVGITFKDPAKDDLNARLFSLYVNYNFTAHAMTTLHFPAVPPEKMPVDKYAAIRLALLAVKSVDPDFKALSLGSWNAKGKPMMEGFSSAYGIPVRWQKDPKSPTDNLEMATADLTPEIWRRLERWAVPRLPPEFSFMDSVLRGRMQTKIQEMLKRDYHIDRDRLRVEAWSPPDARTLFLRFFVRGSEEREALSFSILVNYDFVKHQMTWLGHYPERDGPTTPLTNGAIIQLSLLAVKAGDPQFNSFALKNWKPEARRFIDDFFKPYGVILEWDRTGEEPVLVTSHGFPAGFWLALERGISAPTSVKGAPATSTVSRQDLPALEVRHTGDNAMMVERIPEGDARFKAYLQKQDTYAMMRFSLEHPQSHVFLYGVRAGGQDRLVHAIWMFDLSPNAALYPPIEGVKATEHPAITQMDQFNRLVISRYPRMYGLYPWTRSSGFVVDGIEGRSNEGTVLGPQLGYDQEFYMAGLAERENNPQAVEDVGDYVAGHVVHEWAHRERDAFNPHGFKYEPAQWREIPSTIVQFVFSPGNFFFIQELRVGLNRYAQRLAGATPEGTSEPEQEGYDAAYHAALLLIGRELAHINRDFNEKWQGEVGPEKLGALMYLLDHAQSMEADIRTAALARPKDMGGKNLIEWAIQSSLETIQERVRLAKQAGTIDQAMPPVDRPHETREKVLAHMVDAAGRGKHRAMLENLQKQPAGWYVSDGMVTEEDALMAVLRSGMYPAKIKRFLDDVLGKYYDLPRLARLYKMSAGIWRLKPEYGLYFANQTLSHVLDSVDWARGQPGSYLPRGRNAHAHLLIDTLYLRGQLEQAEVALAHEQTSLRAWLENEIQSGDARRQAALRIIFFMRIFDARFARAHMDSPAIEDAMAKEQGAFWGDLKGRDRNADWVADFLKGWESSADSPDGALPLVGVEALRLVGELSRLPSYGQLIRLTGALRSSEDEYKEVLRDMLHDPVEEISRHGMLRVGDIIRIDQRSREPIYGFVADKEVERGSQSTYYIMLLNLSGEFTVREIGTKFEVGNGLLAPFSGSFELSVLHRIIQPLTDAMPDKKAVLSNFVEQVRLGHGKEVWIRNFLLYKGAAVLASDGEVDEMDFIRAVLQSDAAERWKEDVLPFFLDQIFDFDRLLRLYRIYPLIWQLQPEQGFLMSLGTAEHIDKSLANILAEASNPDADPETADSNSHVLIDRAYLRGQLEIAEDVLNKKGESLGRWLEKKLAVGSDPVERKQAAQLILYLRIFEPNFAKEHLQTPQLDEAFEREKGGLTMHLDQDKQDDAILPLRKLEESPAYLTLIKLMRAQRVSEAAYRKELERVAQRKSDRLLRPSELKVGDLIRVGDGAAEHVLYGLVAAVGGTDTERIYRVTSLDMAGEFRFTVKTQEGEERVKVHAAISTKVPGTLQPVYRIHPSDQAMSAQTPGGIDLTASGQVATTRLEGFEGIQFKTDLAIAARLRAAPGIVPVIVGIRPIRSLADFLGVPNAR